MIFDYKIDRAPPRIVNNYEEAWLYCLTCNHDGHYDWRLPTVDEWQYSSTNTMPLEAYYENNYFFKVEPAMQNKAVPVREVK
jgi:hypothetical protein